MAPTEPAGVVRLATPESLAHELIVPRPGDFLETYPALLLELLSNVHPVSLARDEADIIIRAVRATQGAYTLRRIARVAVGLFASDIYLARQGIPGSPADLARHRLIAWDRDLAFLKMAHWLSPTSMRGVAHQHVHRAAGCLPCRLRPRRTSDYDRRKARSQTGAPRVATFAS